MVKRFFLMMAGALLVCVGQSIAQPARLASGQVDKQSPQAPRGSHVYIQAGLGYGFSHWSAAALADGAALADQSGQAGGLIWGGHVGYAFNQAFAIEAGFYDLAKVRYRTVSDSVRHTIDPNMMYIAARMKLPYSFDHMHFYAKVGPAWRYINRRAEGAEVTLDSVNYATFVSGLGLMIDLPAQVTLGLDYFMLPVRVLAGGRVDATRSPAVYLLVASLGYKFDL